MLLMNVCRKALRLGQFRKTLGGLLGAAVVIGVSVAARYYWGPDTAAADSPEVRPVSATLPVDRKLDRTGLSRYPDVVAVINGQKFSRDALSRACLAHYGKKVLEAYINKHLIALECRRRNITVTAKEVDDEINRNAQQIGLPREQFLELIERERGVNAAEYAKDIVWPTLALRKLAAGRLRVTEAEIRKAYETEYGEARRVQMIQLKDPKLAARVHKAAVANPSHEHFGRLARKHSTDPNSAASNGWIQPIHKHVGVPEIQQVAFSMKLNEISPVIYVKTANLWVILRLHDKVQRTGVKKLEEVRPALIEAIRKRKLRTVAAEIFREFQKDKVVEIIFNVPEKQRQFPGVAARLNGYPIKTSELADECIERHGEEVLAGEINRILLVQALQARDLSVSKDEIWQEVYRAAEAMGFETKDGKVDVDRWIDHVTTEQEISVQVYEQDAVWPSAALKKLVQHRIQVSEEDLQRGFIANYGERARCRVIVTDSHRRALKVFELARKDPSIENFARLAKEYSNDPGGRENGGLVPPIQRFGGRSRLEEQAFKLQDGEISPIIQLDGQLVILRGEGRTVPMKINFDEVRDLLAKDIYEKKIRREMAREFNLIKDRSHVENFVTGEVHEPKKAEKNAAVRR
ncbi:MAG: peptidyl-prolyl cis-trans isomerase [Planctomycetes bacterium]|nr:peptidyl-prolyl cis-trans isomerase [Planctomycetota bacterium]